MKTALRLLAISVFALMTTDAFAQGNSKNKDKSKNKSKDEHSQNEERSTLFSIEEREYVQVYVGEHDKKGRSNCPPGLAKKNNGCMPPGQAKHYHVGSQLSSEIVIRPVPDEISVRIGLPPPGYLYGVVDGDLVKLVVGTLMVVDAIEGLER